MSLLGTTVSLMIGPVFAVDAPAALVQSIRSVQVTQGQESSGFQISFDVEPAPGAGTSTAADTWALLLKPYNRVVVSVSLNGSPTELIDGVITHLELAPAQGGQPSTLTITGGDLTEVMDLWEESVEYPAMDPYLIVLAVLAGYAEYGIIPLLVPPLAVPPLPDQAVPIKSSTDLQFIRYLASLYGYDFYLKPGPARLTNYAYWGPQVRVGPLQPALSVNLGPATNVDTLTFSYDATAPAVAYGSVLDPTSNLEVPVLGVPVYDIPPLASIPAVVANLPYVRATLFEHQGLSVAQALTLASAIVDRSTMDVVVATGELDAFRYGAVLTARSLVGVRGAGLDADGLYYVRSVTHTLETGSWRQQFELVREGVGTTVTSVLT